MKSEDCDERPECRQVLQEKDQWIPSFEYISNTEEYKEIITRMSDNSSVEIPLRIYSRYHLTECRAKTDIISESTVSQTNYT